MLFMLQQRDAVSSTPVGRRFVIKNPEHLLTCCCKTLNITDGALITLTCQHVWRSHVSCHRTQCFLRLQKLHFE